MKAFLTVLITCYNRKDHTLACLKALFDSHKEVPNIALSVYLVDDCSTDGTAAAVNLQYPTVKVLLGNGSLYWGGGTNRAWHEAALGQYDFYLWLNDDTYLKQDALKQLLMDSERFNHQAIIAGVSKWQEGDTVSYSGYLIKDKVALQPAGVPVPCDYFNGNIILVPKYVFTKVGYLDPVFTHNLGDTDYGLRAKKAGINSYITSKIVAMCDGHRTLSPWCNPANPLNLRIKHFNRPITKSPKQVFLFEKRHTSLVMALFRSGIIYIRLLFPQLWILMGKQRLGEG